MRRLFVFLGFVGLTVAAVGLSLPWWFGAVLTSVGPTFGVSVGDYRRVGYTRFAVSSVEVRRDPVVVKVAHAEADTPLIWLWRHWTSAPGPVIAGEWSTEVQPSEKKDDTPKADRGWTHLQRLLVKIANHLANWVPTVQAGRGFVTWPGSRLDFAAAQWKDRVVSSPLASYRALHGAVECRFTADGPTEGSATLMDGDGSIAVRSDQAKLTGHATWWSQTAEFSADFEERGWLPRDAILDAKNFEIPGSRLKLGSTYSVIRGTGKIEWHDARLSTAISVQGQPLENSLAPPLSVEVKGYGANDTFVAEQLNIRLPGITAHLSAPIALDRFGKLRSAPSTFLFEADLAQQRWFQGKGKFQGQGAISANADGIALIQFSVAAENAELTRISISKFDGKGQLEWPRLTVSGATLHTPDGGEATARGGWDFSKKEILDAAVQGRFGRQVLAPWLPVYPEFSVVEFEARASGPFRTAAHQGRAHVEQFQFARTRPMTVDVDWTGEGLGAKTFTGRVTAGDGVATTQGSADRSHFTLTEFHFANGQDTRLALTAPAELRWGERWTLSEVNLSGPAAKVQAAFTSGKDGKFRMHAERFDPEWLRPFLVFPATKWRVENLSADAHWADGPADFTTAAEVTVELGKDRSAQLSTEITGSGKGVEITKLRAGEGGSVIVTASGHLPLIVQPIAQKKWEIDERAPFKLDAATSPNPSFWEKITQLTGVAVVQPEAEVHFEGTLSSPRGDARFTATRLEPVEGRFKGKWPKIEGLNLRAVGNKDGLTLEQFTVAVEGQVVRVSGRLPVAVDYWAELTRNPREFAERSEVHLEIPDAEIAAFVHYFPEYIAPKGRFHLDLTFQGQKSLTGFIRVDDATSRPLGPLGILQEITADIRFAGRTATFEGVTARMGGQLVSLKGNAGLPVDAPPQLNLTLTGDNLPFIRQAGLLVRGDLDLKLASAGLKPPAITGIVRLRDSLFLADVRSLIPSGTKGVASRPPYFALETPPLNTWGLDVQVQGEQFLRLRTPVFNGTATARFKLDGTLGEPRIAGEAIIDQGSIRLPFSSFEVRQGEVRISAGDVEPQIFISATTRRYGYDLRMEVTGNTSAPNLAFSSSPPLEAEQLLLMVMAGEAPRNEVSTTDKQRVARFGAFFGQSLLGSLGGDPTGADRLTISSGGDISEQGRETYNIEYKLADRWALTGEYDEFDDYYGGLKWRIYPKGERKPNDKK